MLPHARRQALCPMSVAGAFSAMSRGIITLLLLSSVICTAQGRRNPPMQFVATAYSVSGITAKGTFTHEGIVAADPAVLPLGSLIQVTGAGFYSGVYAVTDTGSKVEGRKIDIHMPSTHEAKEFGRKAVTVRVL